MIEVVEPGIQTVVQDNGRPGYFALGLPPSGPMDLLSHQAANALVGNDPNAATLESVFVGPTLYFDEDATVAVTGADVALAIDGVSIPTWTTIPLRAGQQLRVGAAVRGARNYVAVRGGFDCPAVMGSRATYLPSALGGYQGRALRAGDCLKTAYDFGPFPRLGFQAVEEIRPSLDQRQDIRIVLGLCSYRFTPESIARMLSSDFVVGSEANRVGYRLSGPALDFVDREAPFGAGADPSNVVDLGYPTGSLQVTGGEELICLLRDGVTGGGYATIGTVIGVDIDRLAQMRASEVVRLRAVTVDDAIVARRARGRLIAGLYREAAIT